MIYRLALALFAVLFVTVSDAFAVCPIVGIFAPPLRTRVTVVHRYAAPVVAVAPVVEAPAPDVEVVAPAPAVVYRQRTVYRAADPITIMNPWNHWLSRRSVVVEAGATGAQRRHANKSAKEAEKSAKHAAKSAYWASRS